MMQHQAAGRREARMDFGQFFLLALPGKFFLGGGRDVGAFPGWGVGSCGAKPPNTELNKAWGISGC